MEIEIRYTLEAYHYEPYRYSYSFSLALMLGIMASYYIRDISQTINKGNFNGIVMYPIICSLVLLVVLKFAVHYYCRCNYKHKSYIYDSACYLLVPIVFCLGFLRMDYYQNSLS